MTATDPTLPTVTHMLAVYVEEHPGGGDTIALLNADAVAAPGADAQAVFAEAACTLIHERGAVLVLRTTRVLGCDEAASVLRENMTAGEWLGALLDTFGDLLLEAALRFRGEVKLYGPEALAGRIPLVSRVPAEA
jgi:hypothetical protein